MTNESEQKKYKFELELEVPECADAKEAKRFLDAQWNEFVDKAGNYVEALAK